MNVLRTAEEIGLVQVGLNVVELLSSEELRNKVGAVMPLPSIKLKDNVEKMVAWIAELGKSKLMFLTPEIALFSIGPFLQYPFWFINCHRSSIFSTFLPTRRGFKYSSTTSFTARWR